MTEEWKKIDKFPLYDVSTLGRVRNRKTLRILAQQVQGSGNTIVCLSNRGKIRTYSVNRLMLETFKPIEGMDTMNVKYKDGLKYNNVLDNLEWTKEKIVYTIKPNELKELKNAMNKYIDKLLDEWYFKYYGNEARGVSNKE